MQLPQRLESLRLCFCWCFCFLTHLKPKAKEVRSLKESLIAGRLAEVQRIGSLQPTLTIIDNAH